MIIYGSKATHLNTYQDSLSQCPNCNASNSITMSVFSKYAHIYWIPLFPLGKKVVSQCQNCKNTLKEDEMSGQMKEQASALKSQNSIPKWQFAGLAIFVALTVFSSFSANVASENNKKYITQPLAGDKYEFKTEDGEYSIMQVKSASKDSVFVLHNQYTINRSTKLSKIDIDSNYIPIPVGYSIKSMEEKLNKGEIMAINRN